MRCRQARGGRGARFAEVQVAIINATVVEEGAVGLKDGGFRCHFDFGFFYKVVA